MKLEFSQQSFEKSSSFIKIRPVGAELFHADGQTTMTKLAVAFRNFSNAPKKGSVFPVHAMKVRTGSRGTHPLILNLGT
jgi:hypothetical protein